VKEATKVLGIKPDNLILYKYPVRTFSYQRQEILEDILLLKKDIQPDLILTPSVNDIHQDHSTVSNEAVRAFKFSTILCYELPWNNFNFATACFSKLENRHLDAKIAALKVYKSQAHRSFVDEDFMRSLARTRGVQMGAHYAEAFEVIRWLF
jgi:N-acetylglucosamine malate deacetylase 1